MLSPFGPDLWLASGPCITAAAGFHYPTRMAVIRLSDGGLFVWSPIPLTAPLQAAVDALGPVRHLIAPNRLHHMSMADWQAAYPGAKLHAVPGLGSKRPDLRIDAALGIAAGDAAPDWSADIDQLLIDTRITPEAVFLHHASRTLIVTDLLQHLQQGWFTGWRGLVARLDLMTAAEPSVPRKFRLAIKDRRTLRSQVDQMLSWSPQRLIFAHGPTVDQDATALLRRAFAWAKP